MNISSRYHGKHYFITNSKCYLYILSDNILDEIIFKQLFKKRRNSNDSSGHKRKTERIE